MNRGIPLLIALSFIALALSPDLRLTPLLPWSIGLVITLFAVALCCERRIPPRWSPALILTLAAFLRLCFLARPPELSDDLYRYLWDAEAVLAGHNPYALAPAQAHPDTPALAALQAKVNHPELVTIYPPAAQLIFAAGGALGRLMGDGALGLKTLLCALDLLTCFALLRILRRLELPTWRLALYAWHPLPVLEVAGAGHIDGAAVCLLVVSLGLALSPRDRLPSTVGSALGSALGSAFGSALGSGAAFAGAVLTKLFPLVLLPVLLTLTGRRRLGAFLGAFAVTAVALCVPFASHLGNGLETLSTYAREWEFASFGFRSLRRWTGSGELARQISGVGFGLACLVAFATLGRKRAIEARTALRAAYFVAFAFLVFTPTLHAWYALYLAAFLPFAAGPAGLAISGSVFLGYRVLPRFVTEGEWVDSDGAALAIVAIPLAAYLLSRALRRVAAHQSPPNRPV